MTSIAMDMQTEMYASQHVRCQMWHVCMFGIMSECEKKICLLLLYTYLNIYLSIYVHNFYCKKHFNVVGCSVFISMMRQSAISICICLQAFNFITTISVRQFRYPCGWLFLSLHLATNSIANQLTQLHTCSSSCGYSSVQTAAI